MTNEMIQPSCRLPAQVIGVLVSLLFAQKNLPFTPLDHFEAFAGTRSVTLGELGELASKHV